MSGGCRSISLGDLRPLFYGRSGGVVVRVSNFWGVGFRMVAVGGSFVDGVC